MIGGGKSLEFERAVLAKLGLEPDLTATQIVQKERLADAGHQIVTLMCVLCDFTNDMRILYSEDIGEVTSRDSAKRLGGSSADASKNNPINWENATGKCIVVQSGMPILYAMIQSDLQRDLRGSVQARYQPQAMMVQAYESLCRVSKELGQLSVNQDRVAANLESVRTFPSEAMVAVMRAHGWVHPQYGVGHDAVKEFSKIAKKEGRPLLDIAKEDKEFTEFYTTLPEREQEIMQGRLELYLGSAIERAEHNLKYAREIAGRSSMEEIK